MPGCSGDEGVRPPRSTGPEVGLDRTHDQMLEGHVNQLHQTGFFGGYDHGLVHQTGERAAALPQKRDRGHSTFARGPRGCQEVGALAAGAVQDEQVAPIAERLDLASEDLLETEIVARGGQEEVSAVRATRRGAAGRGVE